MFAFVEARQRMLCLPFQKYRAIRSLCDLVEGGLGGCNIVLSGGNSALYQPRINFVALVGIGPSHGKRFICIALRVFQLAGLFGDESEGDQGVDRCLHGH